MQFGDFEIEYPSCLPEQRARLNELDSALNDLGMLATHHSPRQQYLQEVSNRQFLNMVTTINTRYVSNVSIGFQVRPVLTHVRYKPYKIPKERHRTKSENNDKEESTSIVKAAVDACIEKSLAEISQLKKAKSLESIISESIEQIKLNERQIENNSEVELVSNSIQNLKVVE